MPGRAQQMTPAQLFQMAPSRYNVPFKVLSNKRALDDAFRRHQWEMQRNAQTLASGERRQKIAGEFGLKNREAINQSAQRTGIEKTVLTQAVKLAQDNALDMNSPEGQEQFTQIYQALLNQATSGEEGALLAASGEVPSGIDETSLPEPVGPINPLRALPGYADYGIDRGEGKKLDKNTAQRILQKAGGDKEKARAIAKRLGYTL